MTPSKSLRICFGYRRLELLLGGAEKVVGNGQRIQILGLSWVYSGGIHRLDMYVSSTSQQLQGSSKPLCGLRAKSVLTERRICKMHKRRGISLLSPVYVSQSK